MDWSLFAERKHFCTPCRNWLNWTNAHGGQQQARTSQPNLCKFISRLRGLDGNSLKYERSSHLDHCHSHHCRCPHQHFSNTIAMSVCTISITVMSSASFTHNCHVHQHNFHHCNQHCHIIVISCFIIVPIICHHHIVSVISITTPIVCISISSSPFHPPGLHHRINISIAMMLLGEGTTSPAALHLSSHAKSSICRD